MEQRQARRRGKDPDNIFRICPWCLSDNWLRISVHCWELKPSAPVIDSHYAPLFKKTELIAHRSRDYLVLGFRGAEQDRLICMITEINEKDVHWPSEGTI